MENHNLTEIEYNICMLAVIKCHMLQGWINAGLPVNLTKKNFGFPDMSHDEEEILVQKLYENSQIAWLRENKV